MNHKGTKTPREPIPYEVEHVAKRIIDGAFRVHSNLLIDFNVPLIKEGIKKIVL